MSMITKSLQVLGTYRMVNLLSFNGMFATFQVVESASQAPGALVVVHKSNITNPAAWEATQRDTAQIAGHVLNRVCPVGGCGEEAAHYFSIYSWLGGRHLGLQVRDGGLPEPTQSFEIAAQIAEGLGALHRKGVVHRVISPASVFIDDSGNVQILHAGWGRLILASRDGLLNPAWGCIVPFVSPEIAAGKDGDEAADVYALGANLYFLLTGQPPHWDDDPNRLVELIRTKPTDLSRIPGSLPPQARELIEEMLSPNPEDRPLNLPALSDRLLAVARKLNALTQDEPQREASGAHEAADPAQRDPSSGALRRPNLPKPASVPAQPPKHASLPSMEQIAAIQPPDPDADPKKAKLRTMLLIGAGTTLAAGAGIVGISLLLGIFSGGDDPADTVPANGKPSISVKQSANAEQTIRDYDTTSERIRSLAQLSIGFFRKNGEWPASMDSLAEFGVEEADRTDPWGTPIEIRGAYVISAGANKKWDDADDIWWDADKNLRDGYHPLNK